MRALKFVLLFKKANYPPLSFNSIPVMVII